MRTVRAEGASHVAALLKNLAEQIESSAATISAVIEFPDEGDPDPTLVEVKVFHPRIQKWNLVELQSSLSHPGD